MPVMASAPAPVQYPTNHRVIPVIEPQSLVVFDCTELLTERWVHMIGKRGGLISYLCRQSRAISRIRTYNHTAWASSSGEEKDNLDHSATGHFTEYRYCISKHLGVT